MRYFPTVEECRRGPQVYAGRKRASFWRTTGWANLKLALEAKQRNATARHALIAQGCSPAEAKAIVKAGNEAAKRAKKALVAKQSGARALLESDREL